MKAYRFLTNLPKDILEGYEPFGIRWNGVVSGSKEFSLPGIELLGWLWNERGCEREREIKEGYKDNGRFGLPLKKHGPFYWWNYSIWTA